MRHHPGDVGLTARATTQECTQIGGNDPSGSFWGIRVHCCAVGLGCGWPWDRNSVHKWEDRASPHRIGAFVYTVGLLRCCGQTWGRRGVHKPERTRHFDGSPTVCVHYRPAGCTARASAAQNSPYHLFVTTGTATRHSKVRLRRRFHAMWLLARSEGACSPSSSPSRWEARRTRQPSYRGACAAPWRSRSVSDVLSGGVEADDLFLIARQDEEARAGAVRSTRPMLAAAGRTSDRYGRRSRASQAARAKRSARSVRMAAVLVPVFGFDKHCAARLPTCRCAPSPPQGRQPPSPRGASCPASRRGCAPAGMPGGRDPASPVPRRP